MEKAYTGIDFFRITEKRTTYAEKIVKPNDDISIICKLHLSADKKREKD